MATDVLKIPKDVKLIISQLTNELKFASKSLRKREWFRLILKTASTAWGETFKTKIDSLKDIGKYFNKRFKTYKTNPKRATKRDFLKTRKTISQIPENIQLQIWQFRNLPKDKQCESAIVTAIALLLFFSAMGGFDVEGGLPDQDRRFGMGKHRHILSHSIILGFGIEFAMRFVILFIQDVYSRLPQPHHKIWDQIENVIQKSKNVGIATVWAGIGVHLFKDANLFSLRTKPYVGIPGTHSMRFHQNLFAANAVVAEIMAVSSIKVRK